MRISAHAWPPPDAAQQHVDLLVIDGSTCRGNSSTANFPPQPDPDPDRLSCSYKDARQVLSASSAAPVSLVETPAVGAKPAQATVEGHTPPDYRPAQLLIVWSSARSPGRGRTVLRSGAYKLGGERASRSPMWYAGRRHKLPDATLKNRHQTHARNRVTRYAGEATRWIPVPASALVSPHGDDIHLKGNFVIRYPDLTRQGPLSPTVTPSSSCSDTPALVEALPQARREPQPDFPQPGGASVRLGDNRSATPWRPISRRPTSGSTGRTPPATGCSPCWASPASSSSTTCPTRSARPTRTRSAATCSPTASTPTAA